jgi:acyl-CoA thioesterase-1
LLEDRLQRAGYPYRVVNASISGDTTSGGRRRLPALLAAHQPSLVIIELGANDGLRGIPLTEIRTNFATMLAAIAQTHAHTLLLRMRLPPNYGPAYTQGFDALYDEFGDAAQGVTLVPFFLSDVILEPTLMQADGLHPTATAQPRLLNAVWPSLRDQLSPLPVSQP